MEILLIFLCFFVYVSKNIWTYTFDYSKFTEQKYVNLYKNINVFNNIFYIIVMFILYYITNNFILILMGGVSIYFTVKDYKWIDEFILKYYDIILLPNYRLTLKKLFLYNSIILDGIVLFFIILYVMIYGN
jgi:hypothetical protein